MISSKNKGFTLAEVLITLGIIGVVAAITIPSLVAAHKAKRLRAQFLKSYSTIQQVFRQMEADDVSTDPSSYPARTMYKTFMKYIQAPFDCGADGVKIKTKILLCYDAVAESTNYYKSFDGNSKVAYWWFDDGQIALRDGTLIMFENSINSHGLWISVDINGYNNLPNRWGYDLFTFEFLDGELRTMGDIQTTYKDKEKYCNSKGSGNLNGIACASLAKNDTDYFKRIVSQFK